LLAQIAWAYHRAGLSVDRDDYLHRALAADPKLPTAHFLLAERAAAAKRRDEARRELETGFENGGEEVYALVRQAQMRSRHDPTLGVFAAHARAHGHGHAPDAKPAAGAAADSLTDAQKAMRERLLDILGRAQRCFPRYVAENNPYVLRAKLF